MNEIIPLKKDIIFKTKIGQISNISLDHDYKIDNDLITGSVDISGSYKMTEASILEEDFYYSIPFSIAISKKVLRDTIKIEIDDFDYSINKDILSVSINLCLTCEEFNYDENLNINESENDIVDDFLNDISIDDSNLVISDDVDVNDNEIINNEINDNIVNITNNIIDNDNMYYTYKVYIVRNNDTIEAICNKYNVSIDEVKKYNNINDIKIGDKIIIPSNNE